MRASCSTISTQVPRRVFTCGSRLRHISSWHLVKHLSSLPAWSWHSHRRRRSMLHPFYHSEHAWLTQHSLRSFISALFWITIGIAAAICIALSPVSQDPYMVWTYAGLGIVGFVAGCTFFLCFRKGRKWSVSNTVVLEAVPVEAQPVVVAYQQEKGAGKM
jgi:hypothetical protein